MKKIFYSILTILFLYGIANANTSSDTVRVNGSMGDGNVKALRGELYSYTTYYSNLLHNASTYYLIDCATNTFTHGEVRYTYQVNASTDIYVYVSDNPVMVSSGTQTRGYSYDRGRNKNTPNMLIWYSGDIRTNSIVISTQATTNGNRVIKPGLHDNIEYTVQDGSSSLILIQNNAGISADVNFYLEYYEVVE